MEGISESKIFAVDTVVGRERGAAELVYFHADYKNLPVKAVLVLPSPTREEGLFYQLDEGKGYERPIAGKFLLVTTTDLNSWDVVVAYKNLRGVEGAFDELKNLLELRPISHRTDKCVETPVFACYLALLTKRLITEGSYSDKRLKELKSLKMHELNTDNESVWMRNETTHSKKYSKTWTCKNLESWFSPLSASAYCLLPFFVFLHLFRELGKNKNG